MCWPMGAFCSKPDFRSARDRRRSCSWSTPMVREWSRTAAITARARWGGHQLASGDVVFTHGATLARFTSPLAHEDHVQRLRVRLCRGDRGDGFRPVAGERANAQRRRLRAEAVEAGFRTAIAFEQCWRGAGENLVDPVLLASREAAQAASFSPARLELCQSAGARCAQSRAGDLKSNARNGAARDARCKRATQSCWALRLSRRRVVFCQGPG